MTRLALAAILLGAGIAGCGSSGEKATPATASKGPASAPAPESVDLEIRTNEKLPGGEEQPRYVPAGASGPSLKNWTANITVKKGARVTLTIVNHDDGAAELPSALAQYENVEGGTEIVDGHPVTSIANKNVSHTLTIPGLGVNAVVPAAPKGGTTKVVFTFTPSKSGSFAWHCYAPCGEGKEGNEGAMSTKGWMEGTVTVT